MANGSTTIIIAAGIPIANMSSISMATLIMFTPFPKFIRIVILSRSFC